MASRLDCVPTSRNLRLRLPVFWSLRNNTAGPLLVVISRSMSPSRSKSPAASPRPTRACAKPVPAGQPPRGIRVALIEEQLRRLRVPDVAADVAHGLVDVAVGDDEIELAVEIEIGEHAPEAERLSERADARSSATS